MSGMNFTPGGILLWNLSVEATRWLDLRLGCWACEVTGKPMTQAATSTGISSIRQWHSGSLLILVIMVPIPLAFEVVHFSFFRSTTSLGHVSLSLDSPCSPVFSKKIHLHCVQHANPVGRTNWTSLPNIRLSWRVVNVGFGKITSMLALASRQSAARIACLASLGNLIGTK